MPQECVNSVLFDYSTNVAELRELSLVASSTFKTN